MYLTLYYLECQNNNIEKSLKKINSYFFKNTYLKKIFNYVLYK